MGNAQNMWRNLDVCFLGCANGQTSGQLMGNVPNDTDELTPLGIIGNLAGPEVW